MKDKVCSALSFLVRFFHLVHLTLCGKKHLEGKKHSCDCNKDVEDNVSETAESKENNI